MFVYKVHHSIADGIALVLLMCNLADSVKMEDIPKVIPKMDWTQTIVLHLTLPFLIAYYTVESLFLLPAQTNTFKKKAESGQLSPVKNACLSADISLDLIKQCGKKHGVTINDVIMTVISASLHEHFASQGDTKVDQITLAVPFSLRKPVERANDFEFDN